MTGDRVTKWPSDQVTKWQSDRVTKWPIDWVTGWQEASQTIDRMVYLYNNVYHKFWKTSAMLYPRIYWLICSILIGLVAWWVDRIRYHEEISPISSQLHHAAAVSRNYQLRTVAKCCSPQSVLSSVSSVYTVYSHYVEEEKCWWEGECTKVLLFMISMAIIKIDEINW